MFGQFINFLYANLILGAPKGMEDKVTPIHAFRGKNYVTGCYQFSAKELEEINKTGVLWLSFMGPNWPPVRVDAFIPAHNPDDVTIFGEEMSKRLHVLYYLDLAVFVLEVDPGEEDFAWQLVEKGGLVEDKQVDVFNLQFKQAPGESHTGDKYLFGEELVVLGFLRDLERLQPLKMLYPMLSDNHLILMKPEKAPEPTGRIIKLN